MFVFEDSRITKYWQDESLLNKNIESELARKIISLKKKCLEKLENNEWTKNDYICFEKFIKKMRVNRFLSFYDLLTLYMDLPKCMCDIEINKLNEFDFINPTLKSDTHSELMVSTVYELYGQFLRLAQNPINESENDIYLDIDEKINMYQDIYNQLHDSNSEYYKLLKETFQNFVSKLVVNEELKANILNLEYIIFNKKIHHTNHALAKVNRAKENRKSIEIGEYQADAFTHVLKKRSSRRK